VLSLLSYCATVTEFIQSNCGVWRASEWNVFIRGRGVAYIHVRIGYMLYAVAAPDKGYGD